MRRAQDGDRHAYEALLLEAAALVRTFVRKRLRPADAVEDVVQDTLLSIHRYRHTYDPARLFRPWMYTIAKHRMLDHVGRQRRWGENEVLDAERLVDERSGAAVPESGGLSGPLRKALALLTKKQREIIQLLKLDGFSVAETAVKTGLSQASVKVTAHRGYKTLRKLIARPAREE
jgi:RNA polymerase sigma-70 factor (ECF subfamily)